MSTRKLVFSINEFYHLFSRGVDKRIIFVDNEDIKRFIRLLYLCNSSVSINYRNFKDKKISEIDTGEKLVAIGAYCLINNHFHILVREIHEKGISKFMSKLLTAYSSYFNKKYDRVGTLFSNHFSAIHVESDEQLKYLYSYIHLNPAKNIDKNWREKNEDKMPLMNYINTFPHSSYLDYINKRDGDLGLILTPSEFPLYFKNPEEFQAQIWEWLNFGNLIPRGTLGKGGDKAILQ